MSFIHNIETIRETISQNKVTPEVILVGVTKTLDLEETQAAISAGLIHLGENRLQNALPKIDALSTNPSLIWHYIGSIQKNKIKKIVAYFSFIHSVDDWETLALIDKYAKELNRKPSVLLEINISGESSKHGFTAQEVMQNIQSVTQYENLNFVGYMTMAPNTQDEKALHTIFSSLKILAEQIKTGGVGYKYLSMGMSNDFKIALAEGSNMIRLGTILFLKGVKAS